MALLSIVLGAVGVSMWFLLDSPQWRAAGLGMLFPGAGFLSVGGWWMLLLPLTLALFVVALVAWFGAGMVVAPLIVWSGSAALAGALAGAAPWGAAPWLALALLGAWRIRSYMKRRRQYAAEASVRAERVAYLPQAVVDVEARAVRAPAADQHELGVHDAAHLQSLLSRALQPVGDLTGYDRIDQFQTASLRYQLNFLGYGLSQVQSQYMPNFHGYLSEAQRRLIEQYLQRPIWSYWRLENLWGNLRYDPNPVGKDNIMLTAYFGTQVAMYMLATGDRRYSEPGSLTFRWSERTAYPQDLHSITRSVLGNFDRSPFCLFPCEPNWVYSGCNFRGLTHLAAYDRLFGTDHLQRLKRPFLDHFDREFTTASGSVVALRSSLTGYALPFPAGDSSAVQSMNLLSAERARHYWAMARHDHMKYLREVNGTRVLRLDGKGIDFGNYKRGFTMQYGLLLSAAREMGDEAFSEALSNSLLLDCGGTSQNGAFWYAGSTLANATTFLARVTQRDGLKRTLMEGPPPEALRGPLLSGVPFPEVIVAKARSHGDDLDLVLYPGKGTPGMHCLELERLQPGRAYRVDGSAVPELRADGEGRAQLSVRVDGRTAVRIQPR